MPMDLFRNIRYKHFKDKKVSAPLQYRFLSRLSRLLGNGYPMLHALETMQWDKTLAPIAKEVTNELKQGYTLDQVLVNLQFHSIITSYLFFSRTSGELKECIDKSILLFEQRNTYTKKFKQIIRYPIILLMIFSILLIVLKHTVLPAFLDLFLSTPEITLTIQTSIFLIDFFIFFISGAAVVLFISYVVWKYKSPTISIENRLRIYRGIPIIRSFLRLQTSFLFATHVGTLLKAGISIKEILRMLSIQDKQKIISHYAHLMNQELSRGVFITSLMTQLFFFEKQLAAIFQKNTESVALEKDLMVYADVLIEEQHRKIMKIITLVQPIVFAVLAGFIVFIYGTLMWPMFQLLKTI